jgi:hypothetical protein
MHPIFGPSPIFKPAKDVLGAPHRDALNTPQTQGKAASPDVPSSRVDERRECEKAGHVHTQLCLYAQSLFTLRKSLISIQTFVFAITPDRAGI